MDHSLPDGTGKETIIQIRAYESKTYLKMDRKPIINSKYNN